MVNFVSVNSFHIRSIKFRSRKNTKSHLNFATVFFVASKRLGTMKHQKTGVADFKVYVISQNDFKRITIGFHCKHPNHYSSKTSREI